MKKHISLVLLSFIFSISCSKSNSDFVTLSGSVSNPSLDSLALYDKNYSLIKTIYLTSKSTFNDTIFIPSPNYYYLGDWDYLYPVYLSSGYNLNISIDFSKERTKLKFEGIGSKENTFLTVERHYTKSFRSSNKDFQMLNEVEFLHLADSVYQSKIDLLNSYSISDKDYILFESFSIEYDYFMFLSSYMLHKQKKDKNHRVSSEFLNRFKVIEKQRNKLLNHPDNLNYNELYIQYLIYLKNLPNDDLSYLNLLKTEISDSYIRDEIAYNMIKHIIRSTGELEDDLYEAYMSLSSNENYKREIEQTYFNLRKIVKGAISPSFEFPDINKNMVKLEDLKGKLVYIDIWGTWCIPCIKELPALKELESEYREKDIHFVSISISDKWEDFKSFVIENELAGIQLYAPDSLTTFFDEYQLKTVPRFILIDRNSIIIDANTFKPSNPKLRELMNNNL